MVPTVKFGAGGLMVWECFSGKRLGPLVKVEGKMSRLDYIQILEKHLLPLIDKELLQFILLRMSSVETIVTWRADNYCLGLRSSCAVVGVWLTSAIAKT